MTTTRWTTLSLCCLCLVGCTALSDFDRFRFAPDAGGGGGGGAGGGGGGTDGGSQACMSDAQCPEAERCLATVCVPRETCSPTAACPSTLDVCVDGECVYVPPQRAPSGIDISSGSGEVDSTTYRVRINVGLPQPMGVIQSTNYHLQLGPRTP